MAITKVILGISGASGAIYGWRLLERLRAQSVEIHLILTRSGEKTLSIEMGKTAKEAKDLADFSYPLESSQLPLFRRIGAEHKRHALYEGGHLPLVFNDIVREVLDWFDTYLGPVAAKSS